MGVPDRVTQVLYTELVNMLVVCATGTATDAARKAAVENVCILRGMLATLPTAHSTLHRGHDYRTGVSARSGLMSIVFPSRDVRAFALDTALHASDASKSPLFWLPDQSSVCSRRVGERARCNMYSFIVYVHQIEAHARFSAEQAAQHVKMLHREFAPRARARPANKPYCIPWFRTLANNCDRLAHAVDVETECATRTRVVATTLKALPDIMTVADPAHYFAFLSPSEVEFYHLFSRCVQ